MAEKRLSGSLALTKLKSAFYTTKKGAKCLLIPLEENFLEEKDGAVYMSVGVVVKDEQDAYGQNGFISQSLPTAKWKAMSEAERAANKLPILGNIKDWSNTTNDSANVHTAVIIEGEEHDDLPF